MTLRLKAVAVPESDYYYLNRKASVFQVRNNSWEELCIFDPIFIEDYNYKWKKIDNGSTLLAP